MTRRHSAVPPTPDRTLQYRLACFLLHNLVSRDVITWHEAECAHRRARAHFDAWGDENPWHGYRTDPYRQRSFGVRLSRCIEFEDCGGMYGHKPWQAGTVHRADVWECPTNHAKRGTCQPGHIYQDILQAKIAEAMQVLIRRRFPQVNAMVVACLLFE